MSKFIKNIEKSVNACLFQNAISEILNEFYKLSKGESLIRISRSIAILLENLFLVNNNKKTIALFAKNEFYKSNILNPYLLLEKLHIWVLNDFSIECVYNRGLSKQNDELLHTCITKLINLVENNKIWKKIFCNARWLLFRRLCIRMVTTDIPIDFRIISILLKATQMSYKPDKHVLSLRLLICLILSLPQYHKISELKSNIYTVNNINVRNKCKWIDLLNLFFPEEVQVSKAPILSNVNFYTLDNGSFSYCNCINENVIQNRKWRISYYNTIRDVCNFGLFENTDVSALHELILCLGTRDNYITNQIYYKSFYLYQVLSPVFINELDNVIQQSNISTILPHDILPFSLSKWTSQIESTLDPRKALVLKAVEEAIKCDQPKYRHGACIALQLDSKYINSHCSNEPIALGSNKLVCDKDNVHRPGSIRHAEIECLINMLTQVSHTKNDNRQNMIYWEDDISNELSIYIVELDSFNLGYCEANACPICITALMKLGIHEQYFSTPYGFKSSLIRHDKFKKAYTLDFMLEKIQGFKNRSEM